MNKILKPVCAAGGQASPTLRSDAFFLRRAREQARLDGAAIGGFHDDDYVVVMAADNTRIGRIFRETIHARPVWRWVVHGSAGAPTIQGLSGSLEEAEDDFRCRYRELRGGSIGRLRGGPGSQA